MCATECQTEELFGPFGSKFNHRDGWASTRILLKGGLQVLELETQQGVSSVHGKESLGIEQNEELPVLGFGLVG